MTVEVSLIQYSKLLGRLVLDRNTTEELGRVDQIWINPETHCAIAITCKSGFLKGNKHTLTWNQIVAFGEDSLVVDPTLITPEPLLSDLADPGVNRQVWTDSGKKVGKITDYLFDPTTGQINYYLFTSKGWTGLIDGLYLIPVTAISSMGSKRLMAQESVICESSPYVEGVSHKVAKAGEFIQQDFAETQRHLDTVKEGLQTALDKGKAIADQLKTKAQTLLKTDAEPSDSDSPQTIDVTAHPVTELTALNPTEPKNSSESLPTE